jgi:hypothetical protein
MASVLILALQAEARDQMAPDLVLLQTPAVPYGTRIYMQKFHYARSIVLPAICLLDVSLAML